MCQVPGQLALPRQHGGRACRQRRLPLAPPRPLGRRAPGTLPHLPAAAPPPSTSAAPAAATPIAFPANRHSHFLVLVCAHHAWSGGVPTRFLPPLPSTLSRQTAFIHCDGRLPPIAAIAGFSQETGCTDDCSKHAPSSSLRSFPSIRPSIFFRSTNRFKPGPLLVPPQRYTILPSVAPIWRRG